MTTQTQPTQKTTTPTPNQILTQTTAQLPQRIQQSSDNNQTEELKQLIHITHTHLNLLFDCTRLLTRETPNLSDAAQLWNQYQQHCDTFLTAITNAKKHFQLGNTEKTINDILELRQDAQFRQEFLQDE